MSFATHYPVEGDLQNKKSANKRWQAFAFKLALNGTLNMVLWKCWVVIYDLCYLSMAHMESRLNRSGNVCSNRLLSYFVKQLLLCCVYLPGVAAAVVFAAVADLIHACVCVVPSEMVSFYLGCSQWLFVSHRICPSSPEP